MTQRVLTVVGLLAVGSAAQARNSPLDGQPAVRHKMELRTGRFELTPMADMSVAADYRATYSAGIKAEWHMTDMLSFGGMIFFGASANTGLSNQVKDSLPETATPGDPTPTKLQFSEHVNDTPMHGSLH